MNQNGKKKKWWSWIALKFRYSTLVVGMFTFSFFVLFFFESSFPSISYSISRGFCDINDNVDYSMCSVAVAVVVVV